MKVHTLNEPINIAIMENEKAAHEWALNFFACELYWWADFFNLWGITMPLPAMNPHESLAINSRTSPGINQSILAPMVSGSLTNSIRRNIPTVLRIIISDHTAIPSCTCLITL